MKNLLLSLIAALILTAALLPALRADGVPEGTNCNGSQLCKP